MAVIGFVMVIFGAKLGLLAFVGTDLPTWDQWDSEGEITLWPWLEGRLTPHQILMPHNEHRIATTKLYVLAVTAANGEWDNLVEATGGAVIHATFAAALLVLIWRWLRNGWAVGGVALLLALFAVPFDVDNTMVGFQVQFYFLLWFTLLHVWLTLREERFSWGWALGQVCGGLGLWSMASGFMSAVAILAVLGWQAVRTRRLTAQQTVTAILSLGLAIAGYVLMKTGAGIDPPQVHGSGQFIWSMMRMLTWPWAALLPAALVALWPAGRFIWRCVKQRDLATDDRILLALYAWMVMQCAAIVYGRDNASVLTSRYLDILAVNLILSGIFLIREWPAKTIRLFALLWLAVVMIGLGLDAKWTWYVRVLPMSRQYPRWEQSVRAYLRTHDEEALRKAPADDLPYPSVDALVRRIRVKVLQQVMPPSVRAGEPVLGDKPPAMMLPPGARAPKDRRYWSSWSADGRGEKIVWESARQSATALPILRFKILGDLGPDSHGLRLVVKSAAGEVPVVPDKAAGMWWKTVNVTRPAGEWWLEATTAGGTEWFAFTEPVQVGRLSWLAGKLIKMHLAIIALGVALLLLGAWGWRRRDTEGGELQARGALAEKTDQSRKPPALALLLHVVGWIMVGVSINLLAVPFLADQEPPPLGEALVRPAAVLVASLLFFSFAEVLRKIAAVERKLE